MSIKELAVFPQWTTSEAQALVGTRKWVLEGSDTSTAKVRAFVSRICSGYWPRSKCTVPILLQVGAYDEKVKMFEGATLAALPRYSAVLVVAQYQFRMFSGAPWPHCIPKPRHPRGTTLTLRVRGSGQFLAMPPRAFTTSKGKGGEIAFTANENCRIIIPICEYHLTCDRLLSHQVPSWKRREGSVNSDKFLGERPGALLFDTWDMDHSYAPGISTKKIVRTKMTCVLRSREIAVCQPGMKFAHWNEDYHVNTWGTVKVKVKGNSQQGELRYKPMSFDDLFTDSSCHGEDPCTGGSGSGSGGGP